MPRPRRLFAHWHAAVSSCCQNRADLVHNALEAARIADVPFVLLLSTPTATLPRTVFGRQFFAIEKAAASCGIPFAILRAPMFTDDMLLVACKH